MQPEDFSATDAATAGLFGRELWRYDGTALTRITDINTGTASSFPSNLIVFRQRALLLSYR